MFKNNLNLNQFVKMILMIMLINLSNNICLGQTDNIPHKIQSYVLSSGIHNGDNVKSNKVFNTTVRIEDAQWLRIYFSQTNLTQNSYIELRSLLDNSTQRLNAKSIVEWKNTSAYFNGDAVEISLYAAPDDKDISFEINEIMVGEKEKGFSDLYHCGITDDRVPSNNPAVGRLRYSGTAWILENGRLVTAGHCLVGADVLEFNVLDSPPGGGITYSSAENQYALNTDTYEINIAGDWGIFEVYPNTETGLKPREKQNAKFIPIRDLSGIWSSQISVTGYGVASGILNRTQQTANGPFIGFEGYQLKFQTDMAPGNSGSPIQLVNNSILKGPIAYYAIGVATGGNCDVTGGYNIGWSTLDSYFWEALNRGDDPEIPNINVTINQILNDDSSVDSVGRWEGEPNFMQYKVPKIFEFDEGDLEVLRGSQKIISSQKYHRWNEVLDNVINHRGFPIQVGMDPLTSNFVPTNTTIAIRTELLDAPSQNFGSINFKDPWLIDTVDQYGPRNRGHNEAKWYSKTSPFELWQPTHANYKGVFLNQRPDQSNPSIPYYTVRAPLSMNIRGINRYFQCWSATNAEFANSSENLTGFDTKAVIFKGANDIVKAVYKGHLMSSTNLALSGNNQRKLVYGKPTPTSPYTLYAGYISGGKIWLTHSTNYGLSWQPEQLISSGNNVSLAPPHPDEGVVQFVWQEESATTKSVYTTGVIGKILLETNIQSSVNPKPVIGRLNSINVHRLTLCAVWKGSNSLRYSWINYVGLKSPPPWIGPLSIPNTASSHSNPSISYATNDYSNFTFYLTYDDGQNIYLRTAQYYTSGIDWSNPVIISGSSTMSYRNAQIVAERIGDTSIAHIVYEGIDPQGSRKILYQRFTQTGWLSGTFSTPVEWTGTNFNSPSIAIYSGRTLAITWQDNQKVHLINCNLTTNSWSDIEHYYGGYGANLASGDGSMPIDNAKFIYESGSSQPYMLNFGNAKRTVAGGGGGCPFVYTWNGNEYVEDNNILPQSEYTPAKDGNVTDYYKLFKEPVPSDDLYKLRVGEFEQERSYLDKFSLIIIDHEPEASVSVSEDGAISQYAKPSVIANAQLDKDDVFKLVYELDGNYVQAERGTTLQLTFDESETKAETGFKSLSPAVTLVGIIEPGAEKKVIAGIVNQKIDGKSINTHQFRLRRNPSFIWIPVENSGSKDGTVQVDINWQQNVRVDWTELSNQLDLPYTTYECDFVYAEHSHSGDVLESLSEADGSVSVLHPGQYVDLEFSVPPMVPGKKRSFIFVSNGRYERIDEKFTESALVEIKSKANSSNDPPKADANKPSRYELSQNRPNPFNPVTHISYSLPDAGYVTLKVYDVLGREVATLVDGYKDAGYYEAAWDARLNNVVGQASNIPSGVYFYRLQSGNFNSVKKMLLLR
ncbi:MAG: T9SS type A sorting domain-containing protein [Bacteroidota bacterium]|nr:T9SS type A sorting domain-containing protein [Bacteroidota bacterium]